MNHNSPILGCLSIILVAPIQDMPSSNEIQAFLLIVGVSLRWATTALLCTYIINIALGVFCP